VEAEHTLFKRDLTRFRAIRQFRAEFNVTFVSNSLFRIAPFFMSHHVFSTKVMFKRKEAVVAFLFVP